MLCGGWVVVAAGIIIVVSIEKPLACSTEMHQKVLLGFPVAIIIEGIAYLEQLY
jgi:hypothetical protein